MRMPCHQLARPTIYLLSSLSPHQRKATLQWFLSTPGGIFPRKIVTKWPIHFTSMTRNMFLSRKMTSEIWSRWKRQFFKETQAFILHAVVQSHRNGMNPAIPNLVRLRLTYADLFELKIACSRKLGHLEKGHIGRTTVQTGIKLY